MSHNNRHQHNRRLIKYSKKYWVHLKVDSLRALSYQELKQKPIIAYEVIYE